MQAWQEQTIRHEQELAAENARLRAELAAHQHLIQSYQFALGLDPTQAPPPQLVLAWHTASDDDIPVEVETDGVEWVFVVDGQPRVPNPVREYEDWQLIKEIHNRTTQQISMLNSTEGDGAK